MPIRAECDICGAKYRLRDQMAGKRLPCKACETEFLVTSELFDEDEEDELLEDDGPRRPAGRHSSSATVPLLIAGGGLFGLLVTIGAGVFFVNYIVSKRPSRISSRPIIASRPNSGIPPRSFSRVRPPQTHIPQSPSFRPQNVGPSRGFSGIPTSPAQPSTTPSIPEQVFQPPTIPGIPATPPIDQSQGEVRLENDPQQPLLITGFTPALGNPGTLLTVTGRGFRETNKVVFAGQHQGNQQTTARFKVVSDSKLQITVPESVRGGIRGTVIEVFTPKAVTVTVPRNAMVIDSPQRNSLAGRFLLIRGNGSLDRGAVAGWAFVENGGAIGRSMSSRVYLQDEAKQSEVGTRTTVYHTPAARTGTVRGNDTNQFVKVPALYPSYVDALFGDRR